MWVALLIPMGKRCTQIVEVSKDNAKKRMWLGIVVRLQSIALLDELMVKLEICYKEFGEVIISTMDIVATLNLPIYTMW